MMTISSHALASKVYHPKVDECEVKANKMDKHKALSCVIYFEAGNQGFDGMLLVGNVVLNRSHDDRFPDRVRDVIDQPNQFSYKRKKKLNVYYKENWEKAKTLARLLILLDDHIPDFRKVADKSKGAIAFHTKQIKPKWANRFEVTIVHKNHIFYR